MTDSKDKLTEQTTRERNSLLDAMYRASPDMIFILARDGRILEVNENATRRYGYSVEEMRSKTVAQLSTKGNPLSKAVAYMQAALRGKEPDFEWLTKDSKGTVFPVEVRLRRLEGADGPDAPAVIAVVRDISERKRTEEAIKNIAADILVQTDKDFYHLLVKNLAKLFDADYAFIGLLDGANPKTVNTTAVWAHGDFVDNMSYSLENTPCAKVIDETICFHPTGIQQEYPLDTLLVDMGVDSYIGAPLFDSHNNPIGLIVVLDSKPMTESPQITEILEIFAARASAEIERVNMYQQLQTAQQKLALHVQQTPLGVIEWDTGFNVTDWNPTAEKIFGYTKQEALGRNARKLIIPPEYQQHTDGIWQALLDNHGGSRSTNGNITKDGAAITCEWYNTPLVTEDGQVIGVASLVADITARVQAEEELKRHRDHLEELVEQRTAELTALNQELESFSYSVSHDLRAPLRHIDGFTQILVEDFAEQLDEEALGYLNRVRNSTQHMGRLIDDLLQLSRVNKGKLKREPINLTGIAMEIGEKLQHYDADRTVTIDIKPNLNAAADHRLVYAMLENLIGNAWKYTSKTDDACIEFGASQTNNDTIFYLRDNGAGFDMEYAGKIFEAFKRLHSESEFEGTGIGLATVHRIISRHGGRIWAEAEKNKGATFYFTLDNPESVGS